MSPLRCSWNKFGDGERVDGCIHRLVPSIVLDPPGHSTASPLNNLCLLFIHPRDGDHGYTQPERAPGGRAVSGRTLQPLGPHRSMTDVDSTSGLGDARVLSSFVFLDTRVYQHLMQKHPSTFPYLDVLASIADE